MYCDKCGAEIKVDSVFCSSCGAKIENTHEKTTGETSSNMDGVDVAENKVESKKINIPTNKKIIFVVAAVILIAMVAIGANFNKNVFRGVTWGMSVEEVLDSEATIKDSGEYMYLTDTIHLYKGATFYDNIKCDVSYHFTDKGTKSILDHIIISIDKSDISYDDLISCLKKEYGLKSKDINKDMPDLILWETGNASFGLTVIDGSYGIMVTEK